MRIHRRDAESAEKRNPFRIVLCVACVWAVSLFDADSPQITYIKSFPKSSPAYVEITIGKDGSGIYKEAADDEAPLKFRLSEKETADIYELAAKLDHFSRPLESGLKVAFQGDKTFRWVNGGQKQEVKFNYSIVPEAQQLWDWFERVTETELRFAVLQRAARFDRLGINDALLQLQTSSNRNRLVAKEQFLPLLDRIASNGSVLHMARERAASLADSIRNPAPKEAKP
jgi:hypothetical protein